MEQPEIPSLSLSLMALLRKGEVYPLNLQQLLPPRLCLSQATHGTHHQAHLAVLFLHRLHQLPQLLQKNHNSVRFTILPARVRMN